jgi:hypothetical protein
VRCRLLNGIPGGDALTGLLPATQAEVTRRHQPIGQDREGLAARTADSASHPDPVVAPVVCLLAPPAMADDGRVATQRTPPWEQLQRERRHPGSVLSLASGSCDKENHGWREGLPLTVAAKFRSEDGVHPPGKVSLERKENTAVNRRTPSAYSTLAGILPFFARLYGKTRKGRLLDGVLRNHLDGAGGCACRNGRGISVTEPEKIPTTAGR